MYWIPDVSRYFVEFLSNNGNGGIESGTKIMVTGLRLKICNESSVNNNTQPSNIILSLLKNGKFDFKSLTNVYFLKDNAEAYCCDR